MLSPDMNAAPAGKFRDPSLVDFGGGRRLELLGGVLVDRPLALPGLPGRRLPDAWPAAAAVFETGRGGAGTWRFSRPVPDPWLVHMPLDGPAPVTLALEVRPAPSGQCGVFLEQVEQWRWLAAVTPPAARMLSLFAHSGAATLALVAAGAEVVHVDASPQALDLARSNARASGLAAAPIRWLREDARTFLAREIRRGARYDGVVLDPPSWGHGPKGQAFAIDRDLGPLLTDLAALIDRSGRGPILLTCHSPRWHHRRLHDTLETACGGTVESGRLECHDAGGRPLALGDFARRPPAR
ncbi:MAG: class I SAM-dependent rRNA methyltransferase [Planctomycetia bacterium]|nr:class I SAM-dependent rRNA methyltransferase [Planctomycetia bacterium]